MSILCCSYKIKLLKFNVLARSIKVLEISLQNPEDLYFRFRLLFEFLSHAHLYPLQRTHYYPQFS